jgi:hypothetical protein
LAIPYKPFFCVKTIPLFCAPDERGNDNCNNSLQMNLHYWAGYISPEIIKKHGDPLHWATEWLSRAYQAEKAGNDLIVFEVPKNELLPIVTGLEGMIQRHFPIPPPGVDPMLFDLSFYKALMGEK